MRIDVTRHVLVHMQSRCYFPRHACPRTCMASPLVSNCAGWPEDVTHSVNFSSPTLRPTYELVPVIERKSSLNLFETICEANRLPNMAGKRVAVGSVGSARVPWVALHPVSRLHQQFTSTLAADLQDTDCIEQTVAGGVLHLSQSKLHSCQEFGVTRPEVCQTFSASSNQRYPKTLSE